MNYFVYIIKCSDNSLYTGIATSLEKRIKQHDGKLKGGAKYTRGKGPVKLIYSEEFKTRSQALKREAEIKKLKREEKLLLPTPSATSSATSSWKTSTTTTRWSRGNCCTYWWIKSSICSIKTPPISSIPSWFVIRLYYF